MRRLMGQIFRQSRELEATPGLEIKHEVCFLSSNMKDQVNLHIAADQAAAEARRTQRSFVSIEGVGEFNISEFSTGIRHLREGMVPGDAAAKLADRQARSELARLLHWSSEMDMDSGFPDLPNWRRSQIHKTKADTFVCNELIRQQRSTRKRTVGPVEFWNWLLMGLIRADDMKGLPVFSFQALTTCTTAS